MRAGVQTSNDSVSKHAMAGSETITSPMAPGRITSLRIFGYSIAKSGHQAGVLSTGHPYEDLPK
jgi:hypothetical protein